MQLTIDTITAHRDSDPNWAPSAGTNKHPAIRGKRTHRDAWRGAPLLGRVFAYISIPTLSLVGVTVIGLYYHYIPWLANAALWVAVIILAASIILILVLLARMAHNAAFHGPKTTYTVVRSTPTSTIGSAHLVVRGPDTNGKYHGELLTKTIHNKSMQQHCKGLGAALVLAAQQDLPPGRTIYVHAASAKLAKHFYIDKCNFKAGKRTLLLGQTLTYTQP